MIFQAVNDEKCVNCVEKTNNLHNSQALVLQIGCICDDFAGVFFMEHKKSCDWALRL